VDHPRRVQVIATTAEGTRSALEEAKRLSSRADSEKTVLLVPQVLSSSQLLEGPALDARMTKQYHRQVFRWMVGEPSVIVIGGRRRWWWPTTAQRIARDLTRAGHSVVFADVG
jgi:hypothetical protein